MSHWKKRFLTAAEDLDRFQLPVRFAGRSSGFHYSWVLINGEVEIDITSNTEDFVHRKLYFFVLIRGNWVDVGQPSN